MYIERTGSRHGGLDGREGKRTSKKKSTREFTITLGIWVSSDPQSPGGGGKSWNQAAKMKTSTHSLPPGEKKAQKEADAKGSGGVS